MSLYILHYASIDEEGQLTIDCQGPFKSQGEAQQQQANQLRSFKNQHLNFSNPIVESCGSFQRIAYIEHLTELQTHIENIEI